MKVLVTGASGMLARALVPTLAARGHEVLAVPRSELDVTDSGAVEGRIGAERPAVVVQCAAYTAVDDAEADEAAAFRVNAEGTAHVAAACQRIGALFVFPSTDYVFAGTGTRPYRPEDETEPLNAYGRSKLAGERAALGAGRALVVRTSGLYGAGGPNFVDTILRAAATRDRLEVVADQLSRPTWTEWLATVLAELIEVGAVGVFHATSGGAPVSWFEFAKEILAMEGLSTPTVAIDSESLGRPAPRPRFSALDCSRLEGVLQCSVPQWRELLEAYLRRRRGADERGTA